MFDDIVKKREKIHGHWKQCPSCGIIFDVYQDGEKCPICGEETGFHYPTKDEIKDLVKAIERKLYMKLKQNYT